VRRGRREAQYAHGFSLTEYPEISREDAECIFQTDCEKLVESGVCASDPARPSWLETFELEVACALRSAEPPIAKRDRDRIKVARDRSSAPSRRAAEGCTEDSRRYWAGALPSQAIRIS
jgi:hypothetical protein